MKIICKYDNGYYNLNEGKEYELLDYSPSFRQNGFTWPQYVTVLAEKGSKAMCHASRFKSINGINCDEFFKHIKSEVIMNQNGYFKENDNYFIIDSNMQIVEVSALKVAILELIAKEVK
jgi:hypothetical protein